VGVFSFPFLPRFSLLAVLGGFFCLIFFPAYLVSSDKYGLVLGYGVGVSCKHSLSLLFLLALILLLDYGSLGELGSLFGSHLLYSLQLLTIKVRTAPYLGSFERKSLFLNASLEFTQWGSSFVFPCKVS